MFPFSRLLDSNRIRPRVLQDGGDILFEQWLPETGEVVVRMIGSCEDCPSSTVTLKQGVERMMMHYIPEVKRVLNKGDEDLPLEERERKSQEEREDMDYIENFNKELDKLIAEEKERMKSEAKKKLSKYPCLLEKAIGRKSGVAPSDVANDAKSAFP